MIIKQRLTSPMQQYALLYMWQVNHKTQRRASPMGVWIALLVNKFFERMWKKSDASYTFQANILRWCTLLTSIHCPISKQNSLIQLGQNFNSKNYWSQKHSNRADICNQKKFEDLCLAKCFTESENTSLHNQWITYRGATKTILPATWSRSRRPLDVIFLPL